MSKEWLSHLKDSVPPAVSGDKLSMYAIALEGWRRGLTLKFFNIKYGNKIEINYSLSDDEKEIKFAVSKGSDVTKEAMKIAKSKILTKKYLSEAKVPVPTGKKFGKEVRNEEIIKYAQTLGFPVVVKPSNANLGKGVFVNISNTEQLETALVEVRDNLGYQEVLVEQHIAGDEYRVYVIDGKVIGAIHRIPANVIGDGKSTIRELIDEKNNQRKLNPNLRGRNLKIDKEVKNNIQQAGYTLDSILPKNEQLFLRKNSNVSTGGEPIDVTNQLTKEIKEIAVKACKAIPGLVQCGVDIMVDTKNNKGYIIELNTRPGIGSHLFPVKGKARDIPKAIVDYYFPDKKSVSYFNENLFFDYEGVKNLLASGKVNEITIPPIPKNHVVGKQIQIIGIVKSSSIARWIQRKALNHKLSGYIELLPDGGILLTVIGKYDHITAFLELLSTELPQKMEYKEIQVKEYKKPVKLGFEIRDKKASKLSDEDTLNRYEKDIKLLQQKIRKTEKKYNDIIQSKWWKLFSSLKKALRR